MQSFIESQQFNEFAEESIIVNGIHDKIEYLFEKVTTPDQSINAYDLEVLLMDTIQLDQNLVQITLDYVFRPGQEYTSMHEIKAIKLEHHAYILRKQMGEFLSANEE